ERGWPRLAVPPPSCQAEVTRGKLERHQAAQRPILGEWLVQSGRVTSPRLALGFPTLGAAAGAILLAHAHNLPDPRLRSLMRGHHVPMAVLITAGAWVR